METDRAVLDRRDAIAAVDRVDGVSSSALLIWPGKPHHPRVADAIEGNRKITSS